MDLILGFLKKLITEPEAIFALASLYFVYLSYKFNYRKDAVSKISLTPKKELLEKSRPELSNDMVIADEFFINSTSEEDIAFIPVNKYHSDDRFSSKNGFSINLHHTYDWYFEVENIGDHPSTEIELEYRISIEKFSRSYDELGNVISINDPYVDFEVDRIEKIPYMAANEKKKVFICTLQGAFPLASIRVKKLKSKQMKFITESTLIDTYVHPQIQNFETFDPENFIGLSGLTRKSLSKEFKGINFVVKRKWWDGEFDQ